MNRIEAIKEMLKNDPSDSFLIYALALEYEKANQLNKAVLILEELKSTQPNYLPTYYKLGKLYELLLNNVAAVAVYKLGLVVAKAQSEIKTLGELNEAIMNLED